ncbi:hypothetical protein NSA19_01005 [Actinomyces bowdenii]|uniref:hypothetical protein n=1 Tax=Actinomyces bowdenii TaxID=131109 RepID=UPI00214D08D0|nr:hypothetical protein [Actinomyces bowdenii]MCR2051455.1 hypothetical protein [Actinomyces bowdenii]
MIAAVSPEPAMLDGASLNGIAAIITAVCTGLAAIAGARWGRSKEEKRSSARMARMSVDVLEARDHARDAAEKAGVAAWQSANEHPTNLRDDIDGVSAAVSRVDTKVDVLVDMLMDLERQNRDRHDALEKRSNVEHACLGDRIIKVEDAIASLTT